jgi:hypothetical protein
MCLHSLLRYPRLACAVLLALSAPAGAALTDLVPLQTDYTVVTCYSGNSLGPSVLVPPPDPNGPVIAVYNTGASQLGAAPLGPSSLSYNWQFDHNEVAVQSPLIGAQAVWNAGNLGEVFGIALDNQAQPNIYVSASMAYGLANWPAGNGPGTVYKLSGTTGGITAFPQLPGAGPNSGPSASLGNLCFHRSGNATTSLFVTNMGDGKIYRMDATTGALIGTPFDHGLTALPQASYAPVADNASLNFTQEERRPWGIGTHGGRLYYSIWSSVDAPPPVTNPLANGKQAEIWSVALDATTGNYIPNSSIREFKLPVLVPAPYWTLGRSSMPVSDIEFSSSGVMILAERYHGGVHSFLFGTHSTRVLEYTGSSGAWTGSPHSKFRIGVTGAAVINSAGGVATTCNGSVWATGDGLAPFQSNFAYGIQRIDGTGNQFTPTPNTNSHLIDLDGLGLYYSKTLIGDVDAAAPRPRVRATLVNAVCPTAPGAPYTVTLNVTNLLGVPVTQLAFSPCPPGAVPAGATSVVPTLLSASLPIAVGGSSTITASMPVLPIGGMACFCLKANPADFPGESYPPECIVCVNLPSCPDCLTVSQPAFQCPIYEGQVHTLTFTATNNWNLPATAYQLLPVPAAQLPVGAVNLPAPSGIIPFPTPVPGGGTSPPITVSVPGLPVINAPITICFIVQLYKTNDESGPFCRKLVCVEFPACPPLLPCLTATIDPASIICPTGFPGNYTVTLTLTNNTLLPAQPLLSVCPPVPPGTVSATPFPGTPLTPVLAAAGGTANYTIQLGGVPLSGVNACFCVSLVSPGAQGDPREICKKTVCVALPPCPCATFSASAIQCPQYDGQSHTASITINNTGVLGIMSVSFAPCSPLPVGAIAGVAVTPFNPVPFIPAGGSVVIPVNLSGIPKSGGPVCFTISVLGEGSAVALCQHDITLIAPQCPPCLPCMSAGSNSPVLCPTVTGGPFTLNLSITNLQPTPAWSALLVPCLPGLVAGEVAATPTPGSIALPPLNGSAPLGQNQTVTVPVGLSGFGVGSGQLACFCVQLFDQQGRKICEVPVCRTLPQCPALCATITPISIACPVGAAGTYSATLQVTNLTSSTMGFVTTSPVPAAMLPPGAITLPGSGIFSISPNPGPTQSGNVTILIPPGVPTSGGTYCFMANILDNREQPVCSQMVCLTLPSCQCGLVTAHTVTCQRLPLGGLKYILTVTVQNTTNTFGVPFNFQQATIAPGAGFSPVTITPVPASIAPGASGTFTTCYTGSSPPPVITLMVTNATRKNCCVLRLRPDWDCLEIAGPLTNLDACEMAEEIVTGQVAAGTVGPARGSAWIRNGQLTTRAFEWMLMPAEVEGSTAMLQATAFQPASGVTEMIGGYSTLAVDFAIRANLGEGQSAGFKFCYRQAGQPTAPWQCCYSKVKRPARQDLLIDWNPLNHSLPVCDGTRTIILTNPSGAALELDLAMVDSNGLDLSLTGDFPSAADPLTGMPASDFGVMPCRIALAPGGSTPLTFRARGPLSADPLSRKVGIGWNSISLIRLCFGDPIDGVPSGNGTVLGSSRVLQIERSEGPVPVVDHKKIDLQSFGNDGGFWVSVPTNPGTVLSPEESSDLSLFQRGWLCPFGAIQSSRGGVLCDGSEVWMEFPSANALQRPGRRFIRIRCCDEKGHTY